MTNRKTAKTNLAANLMYYHNQYYSDMTIKDFAYFLKVTPPTVSRIYAGQTNANLTTLQTIADRLGVSPSVLISDWTNM